MPYRTIKSRDRDRPHPATFPVRIPMMCARLHGLERVTRMMDPFLGLGHSALACKVLGVRFVGFETDEGYLAEARRLIESFEPEAVNARTGASRRCSDTKPEQAHLRRPPLPGSRVDHASIRSPSRSATDKSR